jgi:hypothetical protein
VRHREQLRRVHRNGLQSGDYGHDGRTFWNFRSEWGVLRIRLLLRVLLLLLGVGVAEVVVADESNTRAAVEEKKHRHLHRCQNCGTVWGHGNMMAADVEAHKCPKCGASEWRQFSGLQNEQPAPQKKDPPLRTMYVLDLKDLLSLAILGLVAYAAGHLLGEWLSQKA